MEQVNNNEFVEKRKQCNEFLKKIKSVEDKNILKTVYSIVNLMDDFSFRPKEKDRLNQTIYSNLTDDELLDNFNSIKFNKLSQFNLTHLFQEVYNRQISLADLEKRYVCTVKELNDGHILAYIANEKNVINVNLSYINKAKNTENEN